IPDNQVVIEPRPPRRLIPQDDDALADWLAREFDAPIGLLEPSAPYWRARLGAPTDAFPDPTAIAAEARGRGSAGAGLWRPDPAAGPSWLVIPLARPGSADLLALAGFGPGPDGVPWGPPCPERALRAWGQAIADRVRAEADTRIIPPAGEGLGADGNDTVADRLVRRLRVSDPPERFQRLAVAALRDELGVAAVAWVPGHPREPVVVAGAVEGLSPEGFRTLLPESGHETIRIANRPANPRLAAVRRVVVVASDPDNAAGWVVAINPDDDHPFAIAEVAVLQPVAALIATQRTNARLYADLKDLLFGVIRSLTAAIDAKDPYTCGHSERVARIAVRLGEALGMSPNQRGDLYLMGLLHDVGKIGIEDTVLNKRGALTPEEFRRIQSHVRIGVHILADLKKLSHLLPGVAHHHESLDGSGYPAGLSGEAIPLPARILAVADAFDAMSSSRPYRRRLSPEQIDDIFRKGAGIQWDPKVVDALFACRADIEHIRQKGLGESLQRVVDETLGRS
ncbi:MAG TPA: HD domain-containing phosphohydrolase, partial [Isosphaeraceae bacterium]|nr:HD domain-containing phosphohydrolase [Isosphaeraceae bacterium]